MKPKRLGSMRARMTANFALVIALLMALSCGGATFYRYHLQRRAVDELLRQSEHEVAFEMRAHLQNTSDPTSLMAEEGEEMRDRNLALFVVDKTGRVVAQSQKRIPVWPQQNNDWRTRQIPFGSAGAMVVLAVPWRETEEELREFTLALSGVGALVVLFCALGAWVLVGRTLSPIGHLSQQAAQASTDHLRVRLQAPSDDAEVTGLVDTLNDLLARQAAEAQSKGRFYAAASHELRTPLQALSGFLEVGLSRERSNADLRITLQEAQEQSRQLVELVQDLLQLNQLEMATAEPPAQEVDLADIIERLLGQLQPESQARALHLQCDLSDEEIIAPWNHIEMLARNLLENAVKYATHGGSVRVQRHQSTLSVWNQCAPVKNWDADKYFEPFFRPDAARNSQTGGNGLGLAICKAICVSNGWNISLHQQDNGVSAVVRFKSV